VIHSEPGKIVAQRAIAAQRDFGGAILFTDADVRLNENGIAALFGALKDRPAIRVAYAQVVPIISSDCSSLETMLDTYYCLRHLLPPRRYFHGRAFILRSAEDLTADYGMASRAARVPDRALAERLRIDQGPLVDDIFLSRVIVHTYGLDAIHEEPGAIAYFYPPANYHDLYLSARRTRLEIERLNLLFPEHRYLEEQHFKRSKPTLSKLLTDVTHEQATSFDLALQLEEFLCTLVEVYEISGVQDTHRNIWSPTLSTKTARHGDRQLCRERQV
jgi:hypothetical protein